jgi:hypothetical protein
MSIAAFPGNYSVPDQSPLGASHLLPGQLQPTKVEDLNVRRQPTVQQGRALEILGHAIEYLIDSRMFLIDEPATKADEQATRILMRLSREVFMECAEVISTRRRLRDWITRKNNDLAGDRGCMN